MTFSTEAPGHTSQAPGFKPEDLGAEAAGTNRFAGVSTPRGSAYCLARDHRGERDDPPDRSCPRRLSPDEVERCHARGDMSSLGSISSASANRPRIATLADTSERSIDPTYRELRPARCASSSCVSCRSWRMRRRFAATISLRFMVPRNQIGTIIPGMIVPIRIHRCYFVGTHRFDSLSRQSSGTWITKSSTDGGVALRQQRPRSRPLAVPATGKRSTSSRRPWESATIPKTAVRGKRSARNSVGQDSSPEACHDDLYFRKVP